MNEDRIVPVITYTYGGETYTLVLDKGKYEKGMTYTYTVEDLPLDEDGQPQECTLVSIKEVRLRSSNISVEKYMSGTVSIDVKVITNAPGYELPNTGGPGAFWYTFGGVILVITSLLYSSHLRRKREGRNV